MMRCLNPSLIIKALEHYAGSLDVLDPADQELTKQLKEQADLLQERTQALNMLKAQGGTWLGSFREWVVRESANGATLLWGSQDEVNFPNVTISDLELLAAIVATDALNEFKGQA